MTATEDVSLELDDIQSGALHERPSPYVGTYLLLRIDDRAAGRELVRRLHGLVDCGTTVGRSRPRRLDHRRLHLPRACKALGVPQASLDSFAPEFRRGHGRPRGAAGRRRREQPGALGEAARHARRPRRPGGALPRRRAAARPWSRRRAAPTQELAGVELIWRQDCYQLPTGRTSFGFKDGIGQPAVEGSGRPPSNPQERPLKAGRDHPRLPRRDGRAAADADPGRARPQRHLRRLPQAAHEGGGLPAVPAREGREPRGGGAARRQDGRALAERRAARALARARRPGARRRPAAQQRLPLRRRPARLQVPRSAPTRGARTRATRSTATAASTSACTA